MRPCPDGIDDSREGGMESSITGRHLATVRSLVHTSGKGLRTYRYVRPWISLSARWLQDAGFHEGDSIEIHSRPGALLIFRTPEADRETP